MAYSDSGELLDIGHPEIYADDCAERLFIGSNIRFVLFAWKMIDGVIRRCVTGEVIRPSSSFTPTRLAEMRAVNEKRHRPPDIVAH